jgi:hypothetical protein
MVPAGTVLPQLRVRRRTRQLTRLGSRYFSFYMCFSKYAVVVVPVTGDVSYTFTRIAKFIRTTHSKLVEVFAVA